MKAIKKSLAILVCICLVFSCMAISVFAAEATGSITIQNPSNSNATVAGKTFNVYKIFNATTNGNNTSYSWYKDSNGDIPFYDFFYGEWTNSKNETVVGILGKQENGSVQGAVEKLAEYNSEGHNFELSQIAEELHEYIIAKKISYVETIKADSSATSVSVTDLSYGYYLVYDATTLEGGAVRSAVMLSNVNKDAVITLKANRPQILKQIKKHNEVYGKGTSVSIGDTVTFKITTAVPSHTLYTNYTYYIEDTMHDGLVLDTTTIKVYKNDVELKEGFTLTTTDLSNGVDFKVDFTALMNDDDKYEIGDVLTIVYDAKVTNAIEAQKANQNTAKLVYSNDPTNLTTTGSVSDSANVYSYQFVFTKFAEDTSGVLTNVRLAGAEFQLYRVVEGQEDKLITFTTVVATNQEGVSFNKYIVADENATETTDTLVVHNEGEATITLDHINLGGHLGDLFIFGLSEGTYKLVETKAPDGYVIADAPFEIEIVDQIGEMGSVGTLTVTAHYEGNIGHIVNTNGMAESILTVWAEITNKPGSALPETGGMGTTLFTIVGIVLMAGAVAFFTSRKRSSVA